MLQNQCLIIEKSTNCNALQEYINAQQGSVNIEERQVFWAPWAVLILQPCQVKMEVYNQYEIRNFMWFGLVWFGYITLSFGHLFYMFEVTVRDYYQELLFLLWKHMHV
eukprot:TRINITY_DN6061_c0_g1_i1.p6 TRINITY_DN6061_c0_g1~~TRINITY_DN6061_c0_g1_i1.p6  ORF type:complete len:108 (-),score=0.81 TRINITY_DN6061_c0_g1_i1:521-844(-)